MKKALGKDFAKNTTDYFTREKKCLSFMIMQIVKKYSIIITSTHY